MLYDIDMNELSKQVKAIVDPNLPLITNLSNVSALLNTIPHINWAGFYLANDEYLYLGPFQGEVACTIIPFSKGVCGYCYTKKETIIVPNVNEFKGHIACSSKSKSEIVTPIIVNNRVKALIDIDSPVLDRFHEEDKVLLEEIADILKDLFNE